MISRNELVGELRSRNHTSFVSPSIETNVLRDYVRSKYGLENRSDIIETNSDDDEEGYLSDISL